MSDKTVIEDGAGILWSQETDPVSGRTTLTRLTPMSRGTRSTRPIQTVKVIEGSPAPLPSDVPREETRTQTAFKWLCACNPNSAAEATERLRAAFTQLTPPEVSQAVAAYVRARLS